MKLAPVAFFAYKRLKHTKIAINNLKKNILAKDTTLIIFSDAPSSKKDLPEVEKVRKYIKNIKGFKKIKIIYRKNNLGLANSLISGVSYILKKYPKIIVLEDDLKVSRFFLNYMNEALVLYKDEQRVCSISGYVYNAKYNDQRTFFIRGSDCWGWATWSRAWKNFEKNPVILLKKIKQLGYEYDFNFYGAIEMTKMLKNNIRKKNDSWAIRWCAHNYIKNRLTLFPAQSFVKNIGFDGSGTHKGNSDSYKKYNISLVKRYMSLKKIPVTENKVNRKIFSEHFFLNSNFKNFIFLFKLYKKFKYLILRTN
jgi:hypothetical protein